MSPPPGGSPDSRVLRLVRSLDGSAIPAGRLQNSLVDVQAGEEFMAFEDICSNILDFDVAVSPLLFNEIVSVGLLLGVDESYWEGIVIDDSGIVLAR